MDAKVLEALQGSIAKWEAIVAGTGIDEMAGNCPLCHMFNHPGSKNSCVGCPVMEKTGQPDCWDSPYWSYFRHPTIANAQAELDFLKSLLPAHAEEA